MQRQALDAIGLRRLGWVTDPTPIDELPTIAAELGLPWLGAKRDDAIAEGSGGSKVRKLDVLLAHQPWSDAESWVTSGAIGSGHLVACIEAGERLGRQVRGALFWQPTCESVLDNLAFTASRADRLTYHRGRLGAFLHAPRLLLGGSVDGAAVISPGASDGIGTLGMVRAGLELGEQVRAGELPLPDRIYVALGSGGTAVGLAMGVRLAGLRTEVVAIAVVERLLSPWLRMRRLAAATAERLAAIGLPDAADRLPLRIVRAHLGDGYGHPTASGRAAQQRLAASGLPLDPVYTAKAMAALIDDVASGHVGNALFWHTRHRRLPPPSPDWKQRLPAALQRDLANDSVATPSRRRSGRRRALAVLGLGTVAAALGYRLTGYEAVAETRRLAGPETHILAAIAEAILPTDSRPSVAATLINADRYLEHLPPVERRLLRAAVWLVEQGGLVSGSLTRLSRMPLAARRTAFEAMVTRLDALGEAARGARDIILLGHYQSPESWPALGYAPSAAPEVDIRPHYAALLSADRRPSPPIP